MITIKLFALLKDKAGTDEILMPSDSLSTVADMLGRLATLHPSLTDHLGSGRVLIALNHELAAADTVLRDGDEVALMPPFSGGDAPTRIRIQQAPFSLEQELKILKQTSTGIGGIVTFLGATRDISHGKAVAMLEFEHYPGMAEKKLAEIRTRAIAEFGVIDVIIIHRIGRIPVGEDIVLIAVAAGHRDEAFRACRFCIDELKRITPIWKKETTSDGEVWVEQHP